MRTIFLPKYNILYDKFEMYVYVQILFHESKSNTTRKVKMVGDKRGNNQIQRDSMSRFLYCCFYMKARKKRKPTPEEHNRGEREHDFANITLRLKSAPLSHYPSTIKLFGERRLVTRTLFNSHPIRYRRARRDIQSF